MGHDAATRLRVASLVLIALIGTWLGHAAEYGMAAGWRGVELGLWGQAHAYMVPAAAVLVGASFVLALRLAAVARRARLRAERLWRELRSGVRDTAPVGGARPASAEPHPLGLFAAVGLAQVGLYLLQENVEALVSGLPAPGFGAMAGAHWTASLVQVTFAAWLTLGWVVACRLLHRRSVAVARIEAIVRAIRRRRRDAPQPDPPEPHAPTSTWRPRARSARAPPGLIAA